MKNKYFDIVVKKIVKYKNKIIDIKKIKEIVKNILDTEYTDKKLYKMIYYLKNRNYLESLKKDILFIKHPEKTYTEDELTEKFYRDILKKHCDEYLDGKRYIGAIKALELNLSSFTIPEELIIVNNYKQATEKVMYEKQALFKTYTSKEKDLFPIFWKHTKKIAIHNHLFSIAGLELSIVESLYNESIINKKYTEELIKKALRSSKKIDTTVREICLKNNKHHSPINKLYKIAQITNPTIAEELKSMIKRYSYFIG